jgi:hypothetical protein
VRQVACRRKPNPHAVLDQLRPAWMRPLQLQHPANCSAPTLFLRRRMAFIRELTTGNLLPRLCILPPTPSNTVRCCPRLPLTACSAQIG